MMLESKLPICSQCRWSQPPVVIGQIPLWRCSAQIPEPITGAVLPRGEQMTCLDQRRSLCGMEGRYFEPKVANGQPAGRPN